MEKRNHKKSIIQITKIQGFFFSILIFVLVWYTIAKIVHAPLIVPFPHKVIICLLSLFRSTEFWKNTGFTILRCFLAFFLSVIVGTFFGYLAGKFSSFENIISFPLSFLRAIPVVSFILLALFWFNSTTVPVFVSVIMTLPIMVTSVVSGFHNIDDKIQQAAAVYNFSFLQKELYITLPSVLPFFLSGAVSSFGLSWKVVVAGEVLSLPRYGTGTLMYSAQVHLETGSLLAVTLVVVFLSFTIEKVFSFIINKMFSNQLNGNIK